MSTTSNYVATGTDNMVSNYSKTYGPYHVSNSYHIQNCNMCKHSDVCKYKENAEKLFAIENKLRKSIDEANIFEESFPCRVKLYIECDKFESVFIYGTTYDLNSIICRDAIGTTISVSNKNEPTTACVTIKSDDVVNSHSVTTDSLDDLVKMTSDLITNAIG